jgi:hypothetical protein
MALDPLALIEGLENYGDTLGKDGRRFIEFMKACEVKQKMLDDALDEQIAFDADLAALSVKWIGRAFHVASHATKYIGKDPFPGERELTRDFIDKWDFASFPEGKVIAIDMG